jgi:hypothetical protein
MHDVVGNVQGVPYAGDNVHGTGHPPELVSNAFTFNSLSDPVYRFRAGSTAVRFPGRGWDTTVAATLTASPRTLGIIVKPWANANAAGATTTHMWGSGNNTLGTALAYQVSTAGVITLGLMQATTFASSSITLTSGKTYAITCTITSSTGRLWNVYCYDDLAYVTNSSTGNSVTSAALTLVSQNQDAYLNPCPSFDSTLNTPMTADVYTAFISFATFDPATNSYFANFIDDPCGSARGTYTVTGTLAATTCANWDTTRTSVTIQSNRPSLGAAGGVTRYSYRLHRGTVPNFTPDASTRVTSLQSSPVLVDTTLQAGVTGWYSVEQTDGTTTVYSTNQVPARLSRGDVYVGIIGDSRSYGNYPVIFAQCLRMWGWRVGVVNRGVSGTRMYDVGTAANSWQPNTTQDAVNGQSGTTLLANAMAAFTQHGGIQFVISDLGVNDSAIPVSTATFQQRYPYIASQLTASFGRLCIAYPYHRQDSTLSNQAQVVAYQTAIDAIANGNNIIRFDSTNFEAIASGDIATFATDGLHISNRSIQGMTFARSFARRLLGDVYQTVYGV